MDSVELQIDFSVSVCVLWFAASAPFMRRRTRTYVLACACAMEALGLDVARRKPGYEAIVLYVRTWPHIAFISVCLDYLRGCARASTSVVKPVTGATSNVLLKIYLSQKAYYNDERTKPHSTLQITCTIHTTSSTKAYY